MDIDEIISGGGLVFPKAPRQDSGSGKVKTKAKKKQYVTGAHGSGSAARRPSTASNGPTGRKGEPLKR